MRRKFYWHHMLNDLYQVLQDIKSCASIRGTSYSHQKHPRLFPANGSPKLITMHLLGPLPKTKRGHQIVLVITDLYFRDRFLLHVKQFSEIIDAYFSKYIHLKSAVEDIKCFEVPFFDILDADEIYHVFCSFSESFIDLGRLACLNISYNVWYRFFSVPSFEVHLHWPLKPPSDRLTVLLN